MDRKREVRDNIIEGLKEIERIECLEYDRKRLTDYSKICDILQENDFEELKGEELKAVEWNKKLNEKLGTNDLKFMASMQGIHGNKTGIVSIRDNYLYYNDIMSGNSLLYDQLVKKNDNGINAGTDGLIRYNEIDKKFLVFNQDKRMKKDGLWKLIGMGKVVDYYRSHNTGFIKFEVLID